MPAVSTEPKAIRVPRTSSSIACRASITLTSVPSHNPSARSRQASSLAHPISTTVARLPARQDARAQVRSAAGSGRLLMVGSREATALDENVSQRVYLIINTDGVNGQWGVTYSGTDHRLATLAWALRATKSATPMVNTVTAITCAVVKPKMSRSSLAR